MKKVLIILTAFATIVLASSCQKELPESFKNVEISKGGDTPNPSKQENIPLEKDNPTPTY